MVKEIWFNLPVKDLARSRAFYKAIGFKEHPNHAGNPNMGALVFGEAGVMVMLFPEEEFKKFNRHPVADTSKGTEIIISLEAGSPEEVDEVTEKIRKAGGTIFGEPGWNQGWMYGNGFTDPDGHRWNHLYMDMSKAAQG